MQLAAIALSNFRSFPQAHVALPSSGLLMVAGANNAGKSALLSALDVIAGVPLEGNPPVTFAQAEQHALISAQFALSVEERRQLVQSFDLKVTALEDGALSVRVVFPNVASGDPRFGVVRT